jgi:hypothetical protein
VPFILRRRPCSSTTPPSPHYARSARAAIVARIDETVRRAAAISETARRELREARAATERLAADREHRHDPMVPIRRNVFSVELRRFLTTCQRQQEVSLRAHVCTRVRVWLAAVCSARGTAAGLCVYVR